jgi:hypothetical protein
MISTNVICDDVGIDGIPLVGQAAALLGSDASPVDTTS